MKKILIHEIILNSWFLTKKNFRLFFSIIFTTLLIYILFYISIFLIFGTIDFDFLTPTESTSINILSFVLGIFISIGRKNINLKTLNNTGVNYSDFFDNMGTFFMRFFTSTILIMLIFIITMLIPVSLIVIFKGYNYYLNDIILGLAIILRLSFLLVSIIRIQFFPYIIIDKLFGPINAILYSWKITRGYIGKLFLFELVKLFYLLIGTLFFLIGLFRAIPLVNIATANFYKKLSENYLSKEDYIPDTKAEKISIKKPLAKKPSVSKKITVKKTAKKKTVTKKTEKPITKKTSIKKN